MGHLISCHCSYFQRTHSLSTCWMNEMPEKTLWRNSASKKADVRCSPDAFDKILKADVDPPALYSALHHWPPHPCFYKAGLEELQFQLRNCHARNSAPVLQSLKSSSAQGGANNFTNAQRASMLVFCSWTEIAPSNGNAPGRQEKHIVCTLQVNCVSPWHSLWGTWRPPGCTALDTPVHSDIKCYQILLMEMTIPSRAFMCREYRMESPILK